MPVATTAGSRSLPLACTLALLCAVALLVSGSSELASAQGTQGLGRDVSTGGVTAPPESLQHAPRSGSAVDRADLARRHGPIVAIGDSFLAGLGAGDYRLTPEACRQSQRSPARLLAIRTQRVLIDLTCPNAQVAGGAGALDVGAQAARIPRDAALVLLGAGGNDIGFARLAGPCLVAGAATCGHSVAAALSALPGLTKDLTRLLLGIRRNAPAARVVVVGYPPLVRSCTGCAAWIGTERVDSLVRVQSGLDRALATAAVRSGSRFIDWPEAAALHTLCDADPWYVVEEASIADELLHPTYPAARAMGRQLLQALGTSLRTSPRTRSATARSER